MVATFYVLRFIFTPYIMDRNLFLFCVLVCGLCGLLLMSTCQEAFEPAPLKIYEKDLGIKVVDGRRVRLFESRDESGTLARTWSMPVD